MSKRVEKKNTKLSRSIEKAVNDAFINGFASVLKDIEYRIETLMDVGIGANTGLRSKVNSRDLNLASPILDGFVITDNSPSAGYVKWTGCNVVYKGVNVAITDGNTSSTYVWWKYSATPNTVFQTSNTFPTLTDDDVIICVNVGGTHTMNIGDGRATHGLTIASGTVTGTQIGTGAVATANIANSAITGALLANGAVGSGNIASGAVTNAAIAANAVQSTNIASGAVGSTALAAGAVTNTALGSNAVQAANIAAGAVGSSQIGAGAVASSNLNLAQHLLY